MIEMFAQLVRLVEETDFYRCFCNDGDDLQQALIRFPGDQLALAMGGHQWKPALPFRVCRSLAR